MQGDFHKFRAMDARNSNPITMEAPDLTRQPPRSPRERVGGYVILGRAIDKCRADIAGTVGDYHTDCPTDHLLLDWKGVEYPDLRQQVESGADDEAIARWLDGVGRPKTPEEKEAWNEQMEKLVPYEVPAMRDFITREAERLGLDAKTLTLFDYLETDDARSFGG